MRVVYIDSVSGLGGAEHLLLRLLDNLPVEVIRPSVIVTQEGPLVDEIRRRAVPVTVIPLPSFRSLSWVVNHRKVLNPIAVLLNLINLWRSARRLAAFLRKENVDLVQTNSNFAHIYGAWAAKLAGIPAIWYFHDLIETKRLYGLPAKLWRLLAAQLATHIVAVSKAVKESLGGGSRVTVIYAGQPALTPSTIRLREQFETVEPLHLIGFVGRIAYVKGLDILVDAAALLIRHKLSSVHFVIFGEVSAEEAGYKQALMASIRDQGLTDCWHWMGYTADPPLAELDIVTLPSRREALGLVLLEAGLAGKPAVASRIGGIPEALMDGETGILVAPENPLELANALLKLLENPVMAAEMGSKAQDWVCQTFTIERQIRGFLDLYAATLKE